MFDRRATVIFRLLIFLLLGCPCAAAVPQWAFEKPAMLHAIEQAERFTVYSLDPTDPAALPPEKLGPETVRFRGYVVLGQLADDSAQTRDRVRQALIASLEEKLEGPAPNCFAPRIGISLTVEGKQQDILLCFQCLHGIWFLEDGQVSVSLLPEAEAEFNALLDERSIVRDIPKKPIIDTSEPPPTFIPDDEADAVGGVPEPEFWMLLLLSWAVGSIPTIGGGVVLGLGIHRKSNVLKIVGLLILLVGIAIIAPMTFLLAMWVIHWITV